MSLQEPCRPLSIIAVSPLGATISAASPWPTSMWWITVSPPEVGAGTAVGVLVAVTVGVGDSVLDAVGVGVGVAVLETVGVEVAVGVGVAPTSFQIGAPMSGQPAACDTDSPASNRSSFSESTGVTSPPQSTSPHMKSAATRAETVSPKLGQSPVLALSPASYRNVRSESMGFAPPEQLWSPQVSVGPPVGAGVAVGAEC